MRRALFWLAALSVPLRAGAEALDWEVHEEPAGPAVGCVRGVRDGVLGLLDSVTDLQLGLFSEGALLGSSALMLGSDAVGLVDDNPVTQYVFKAAFSKSLARTSYLLHLAGAEAVLGSHGLETDWYLEAALTDLSPLLDEAEGPAIPLDPLDFVEEGYLHTKVYRARVPGAIALSSVVADGVVRPVANLLRIAGFRGGADALDARATAMVRRAVE